MVYILIQNLFLEHHLQSLDREVLDLGKNRSNFMEQNLQ